MLYFLGFIIGSFPQVKLTSTTSEMSKLSSRFEPVTWGLAGLCAYGPLSICTLRGLCHGWEVQSVQGSVAPSACGSAHPEASTTAVCRSLSLCRQGWGVWTDRLMWICAVRWLCRARTIKSLQFTPLTGLLMTKSQLFLQVFLISILKKIGNDMVK